MALININDIKTPEELERIARRDLEGKTLAEIAETIRESDKTSRVSSKAGVGYVVEEGYLGIKRNNVKGADIPHLDVEVKSSALKTAKDGLLRSKEPVSLNIINYMEEHVNSTLKESSLYKKNRNILFVFYFHDKGKERSEYLIKYVFLWKMDDSVLAELEPDYEAIIAKVRSGNAHNIHQKEHKYLTLCPKHGGSKKNPNDNKWKTRQPFSDAPGEIRAYRLKCKYVNMIIQRELAKRGPEAQSEFVAEKS
ncbi:MAG: MutH/Sau3AI family endonuclease [Candidatus Pacebacteria bacterium]|nr:MutH/Sau3AI family endonuclease [Candidatus Paceibacterota bacterium]